MRRATTAIVLGLHLALLLAVLAAPTGAAFQAVGEWTRGDGGLALADAARRWPTLLANTLVVAGTAVTLALVAGALLGLLATRTNVLGRRLIPAAALFGFCTPIWASAVFLANLLGVGEFTGVAWAPGVIHGLLYVPLATLLLAAAWSRVDPALEEAALLDADGATVLRRVSLPALRWTLAGAALLIAILTATDCTITDLFAVRTFAEEVYTQFAIQRSTSAALATGLPTCVLLVGAVLVLGRAGRRASETWATAPPAVRWRWPLPARLLGSAAVAAAAPIPLLLTWPTFRQTGGATEALSSLARLAPELGNSLLLAGCAATMLAAAAPQLAAWSLRRGPRGAAVRWALLVVFAMPAPLVGVSLIELLNRPGPLGALSDSAGIIVLGYAVRLLPVSVVIAMPAVQRIPPEQLAAARLDGADWLALQRHLVWPLARRELGLVWLATFVLAFGDVITAHMVAPPQWPTAAVRAFTLLHFGMYPDLATLSLAAGGFGLLTAAGLWIGLRKELVR